MNAPLPPSPVAVVGGGRMGGGVAVTFAAHGSRVVVVEIDEKAAEAAAVRISRTAEKAAAKAQAGPTAGQLIERIRICCDPAELSGADLVIEAVPEAPRLKEVTLRLIEDNVDSNTVVATNTSSISVNALSQAMRHPQRFAGMHFFNPVPPSALVEVVAGEATGDAVIRQIRDWVKSIGKHPVVVSDSPGFASSRLGLVLALEAMRMLEEGVASAEDIDSAMVLGYRHASGPLATTDLVGLDVRLNIAEYLESTLGPRFAPPQILRDKVQAGDLGRKTGRGFFDYTPRNSMAE